MALHCEYLPSGVCSVLHYPILCIVYRSGSSIHLVKPSVILSIHPFMSDESDLASQMSETNFSFKKEVQCICI